MKLSGRVDRKNVGKWVAVVVVLFQECIGGWKNSVNAPYGSARMRVDDWERVTESVTRRLRMSLRNRPGTTPERRAGHRRATIRDKMSVRKYKSQTGGFRRL